jgi:AAA15 family ATPase/GTPase
METLNITNFITLSQVDIEIKRYNVLIGRQSSGKSLIAKLLYFFKSDFPSAFLSTIKGDEENSPEDANSTRFKKRLDEKLFQSFLETFNPDYWGSGDFVIAYTNGDHKITIRRSKRKIKVEISQNFRSDFIKLKAAYLEYGKVEEGIPEFMKKSVNLFVSQYFSELKNRKGFPNYMFSPSLYIPAGRGFFALLEQNIFSFLSMNSSIDKFISEFGSFYSNAKRYYMRTESNRNHGAMRDFNGAVNDIIGGEFNYKNDAFVISQRNGIDIKLEGASSGQQEVVPMLISLSVMSRVGQYRRGESSLFIEEPEAHLFPRTQKEVIYAIAALHNKLKLTTFITTHSPYVLSSLNNLVIADIARTKIANDDKEKIAKLDSIIKPNVRIKRGDYSAYSIDNHGKVISIIGDDGIIGVNNIDDISEDISNEFDNILNLMMDE